MWITFLDNFIYRPTLLALVKAEQMLMIRTGHVPKFIRLGNRACFCEQIFLGRWVKNGI